MSRDGTMRRWRSRGRANETSASRRGAMKGKKWLLGGAAVGLLLAGSVAWWFTGEFRTSQTGDPMSEALLPLDSGQVEQGRALYLVNCAQCHGINGAGHDADQTAPLVELHGDLAVGAHVGEVR